MKENRVMGILGYTIVKFSVMLMNSTEGLKHRVAPQRAGLRRENENRS
jgi:hypothetical protein